MTANLIVGNKQKINLDNIEGNNILKKQRSERGCHQPRTALVISIFRVGFAEQNKGLCDRRERETFVEFDSNNVHCNSATQTPIKMGSTQ
jgi:hypothetical protein